jgi:hypothetical protein
LPLVPIAALAFYGKLSFTYQVRRTSERNHPVDIQVVTSVSWVSRIEDAKNNSLAPRR